MCSRPGFENVTLELEHIGILTIKIDLLEGSFEADLKVFCQGKVVKHFLKCGMIESDD